MVDTVDGDKLGIIDLYSASLVFPLLCSHLLCPRKGD